MLGQSILCRVWHTYWGRSTLLCILRGAWCSPMEVDGVMETAVVCCQEGMSGARTLFCVVISVVVVVVAVVVVVRMVRMSCNPVQSSVVVPDRILDQRPRHGNDNSQLALRGVAQSVDWKFTNDWTRGN